MYSKDYGDEYDIPPGRYSASVIEATTAVFFGGKSKKVVLTYRILDSGPFFEKLVRGYYEVREIKGRPRRNGKFQVGPRARLVRDVAHMVDGRPPLDRIPIAEIETKIVEIELRVVSKIEKQALADTMQYVVVDRVVRRLEG